MTITAEEAAAGKRCMKYVMQFLGILSQERDPAIVMATLSSLTSLVCRQYGITAEQFHDALVDSMRRGDELRAARSS